MLKWLFIGVFVFSKLSLEVFMISILLSLQIFRLVLQGQIEKACRLLSLHSARQTDDFQTLINLLKRMPQLSVSVFPLF